jgi:hypothetical protein
MLAKIGQGLNFDRVKRLVAICFVPSDRIVKGKLGGTLGTVNAVLDLLV